MRPIRYFSLDEANRARVQVAPLLARLKDLHARATSTTERLDALWQRLEAGERVLDDIAELQGRVDADARDVAELLGRLEEFGCVLRDVEQGLVDFPARADGTEFYLCWHLGESAIGYWHGVQEGFAGRKPLTTMPGRLIH